jgi:hypothetical protein
LHGISFKSLKCQVCFKALTRGIDSRVDSGVDSGIGLLGENGANEMRSMGVSGCSLVHLITQKRFELR